MNMSNHSSDLNKDLIAFLKGSVSKYHAVSQIVNILSNKGFSLLREDQEWNLKRGGKYFVVWNNSSVIGFINGERSLQDTGVKIIGAHTDSPSLTLKPNPITYSSGYSQLGVEVYGGALLKPWFDRDLSVAGRIVFKNSTGDIGEKLIDFERPICVIPSLAIHLNRDANGNSPINPQTDILPILSQNIEGQKPLDEMYFNSEISDKFLKKGEILLDHDLNLYDVQPPSMVGFNEEFISSQRLDNLVSCFIGTMAILGVGSKNTSMIVFNDHEEGGSVSTTGADGPFLDDVIRRVCYSSNDCNVEVVKAKSFVLSCDNAHAVHPNFVHKHDPQHKPQLNGGIVIKYNTKQRYTTDGYSAALFKDLCARINVPIQSFVSRNDMPCGSTIGPLTAGRVGIRGIDIGICQLAMHSCREIIGSKDPLLLRNALSAFLGEEL